MKAETLLKQSLADVPPRGGNFVDQALESETICSFVEGQWLYTEKWVNVFRRVQTLYVERVQQRHQFREWMFPRVIPKQALHDFKLTHYKPGMLFGVGAYEHPNDYHSILDPVQCVPFYYHLRNRTLSEAELPLRIVECLGGWTWRNEPVDELDGPIKAREFARVESVFVGTPDQVREARNQIGAEIRNLLGELGLSWRIVVGVGCMDIPSLLEATDEAASMEDVPVQDIEILIDEDDWLEVSGCTVEGDHLTSSFDIKRENGGEIWSGCCGLGMNRVISSLFLQHGFDLDEWPAAVRNLLNLEPAAAIQ